MAGHSRECQWRIQIMKLSTTINFFTYEDDGSYSAYYYDLEHYAKLGFSHLDSIFCSADAPFSPLWTNRYEDWAHKIRKKADELGITFVQTHVPFYNFCDPKANYTMNSQSCAFPVKIRLHT